MNPENEGIEEGWTTAASQLAGVLQLIYAAAFGIIAFFILKSALFFVQVQPGPNGNGKKTFPTCLKTFAPTARRPTAAVIRSILNGWKSPQGPDLPRFALRRALGDAASWDFGGGFADGRSPT